MSKLAKNSEKNHGIGSSLRVSELAKAQGLVKDPMQLKEGIPLLHKGIN